LAGWCTQDHPENSLANSPLGLKTRPPARQPKRQATTGHGCQMAQFEVARTLEKRGKLFGGLLLDNFGVGDVLRLVWNRSAACWVALLTPVNFLTEVGSIRFYVFAFPVLVIA
jgi:hypothetical protein